MASYQTYIIYAYDAGSSSYDVYITLANGFSPYAAVTKGGTTTVLPYNPASTQFGGHLEMLEDETFDFCVVDGDWNFDYHRATYTASGGEITASNTHSMDTSFYLIS
jgi:hypothetical protein